MHKEIIEIKLYFIPYDLAWVQREILPQKEKRKQTKEVFGVQYCTHLKSYRTIVLLGLYTICQRLTTPCYCGIKGGYLKDLNAP